MAVTKKSLISATPKKATTKKSDPKTGVVAAAKLKTASVKLARVF